jgi:hypothetical protein
MSLTTKKPEFQPLVDELNRIRDALLYGLSATYEKTKEGFDTMDVALASITLAEDEMRRAFRDLDIDWDTVEKHVQKVAKHALTALIGTNYSEIMVVLGLLEAANRVLANVWLNLHDPESYERLYGTAGQEGTPVS